MQADFNVCLEQGDPGEILDTLRDCLAETSPFVNLPGEIADYMDKGGQLNTAHLQTCINAAITTCRDRIDHLRRKMHPGWEMAVLKKLQTPYVEIDQIIRHLIEKGDVETNSEMHARNDSAKDTIVDNLEHRIRDLPPDEPQVRALQSEVDGQKHVCTYPEGKKFAKSVMMLDGKPQEARLIENPYLDVEYARSVVLKNALIVFN